MPLLDALYMARPSWDEVSQTTMQNSFKHAGFVRQDEQDSASSSTPEELGPAQGTNSDVTAHCPGTNSDVSDLIQQCTALTESAQAMSIEEYINVDEAAQTAQTMSLTDTAASVRPSTDENNDEDEDKEDDEPALPQVTNKGVYKLWLK
ncbi:hypothetical protein RRG08_051163 [Elysia crispata]|uniref:Uncharacterized protein n=1 Tax=Elysia crispata TaxID=231223 RepID=A0AAE1D262_9GAST|nr:hypothetical protein RRG08_051163 [Elysia crispata]